MEREKERLRVEAQSSRKEVSELKREIESMKREEKSLRQVIQQAESDIGRHKKDIDNVMNERDILGTQLVRRNDELSLQFSRIKVLHGTLQRGEAQYNQRLEEIKLLKLEVKKLRTEKTLLTKYMANMSDLRQEVFHLNRDLTKERLKVMALEEEVQTPLNIHRWRKLEVQLRLGCRGGLEFWDRARVNIVRTDETVGGSIIFYFERFLSHESFINFGRTFVALAAFFLVFCFIF